MTDKHKIRDAGRLARREMTQEERTKASVKIAERIAQTEIFEKAKTILIYQAMPDEVDLNYLTEMPEAIEKKICYPHVIGKGKMKVVMPSEETSWIEGKFGIHEPDPATAIEVRPEDLDLILCPCTAFDENAGRMGMGGGYYDRYLPLCVNAAVAAVAFESQKVQAVPMEEHDIRMDVIFTEEAEYRPKDIQTTDSFST